MTLLFLPSLIGWLPIFCLILHLAIRAVAAHDEDYTGSHPFRLYPWFVLLVLDLLLIFTCFLFLKQYNKKLLRHIARNSIEYFLAEWPSCEHPPHPHQPFNKRSIYP